MVPFSLSWLFARWLCCLHRGHVRYASDSCDLLTDADGPAPLELPNQWLWDIIDEFIYQVRAWKQLGWIGGTCDWVCGVNKRIWGLEKWL